MSNDPKPPAPSVGGVHELKTWRDGYRAIVAGRKNYEFRKDDRGFKVGDILKLREWHETDKAYTGYRTEVEVTYITRGPDFGVPVGYCVMSIAKPSVSGEGQPTAKFVAQDADTCGGAPRIAGTRIPTSWVLDAALDLLVNKAYPQISEAQALAALKHELCGEGQQVPAASESRSETETNSPATKGADSLKPSASNGVTRRESRRSNNTETASTQSGPQDSSPQGERLTCKHCPSSVKPCNCGQLIPLQTHRITCLGWVHQDNFHACRITGSTIAEPSPLAQDSQGERRCDAVDSGEEGSGYRCVKPLGHSDSHSSEPSPPSPVRMEAQEWLKEKGFVASQIWKERREGDAVYPVPGHNISLHDWTLERILTAFAEAYAQSLLAGKEERITHLEKAIEQGAAEWLRERARIEQERDEWQTRYYEAEEWVCSCNLVDDPKLRVICQFHQQTPSDKPIITLAQRAEAAEQELARLRQRWIAIESAPKTGEHIIVAMFVPGAIGFGVCGGKKQDWQGVAHWWDNPGEEGWYLSSGDSGQSKLNRLTHWQPLPAPPEGTGG